MWDIYLWPVWNLKSSSYIVPLHTTNNVTLGYICIGSLVHATNKVCTIYMRLFSVPVICICYIPTTYYPQLSWELVPKKKMFLDGMLLLPNGSPPLSESVKDNKKPKWFNQPFSKTLMSRELLLQVQWNINNTVLQWFTITSYTVHCKKHGKYLKSVNFFHVSQFPL